LLLWQLTSGHRPTIRYKVNPVDKEDTTIHESRFFPNAPDVIYLHAHSGSSPYLPSRPSGFDIDIYQEVACPVRQASLSIDWGSSLAKMVTRYRMAGLAWIIGWVAHLMVGSATFVELTGEYSNDCVLDVSLKEKVHSRPSVMWWIPLAIRLCMLRCTLS
jgi:hypothetical protein